MAKNDSGEEPVFILRAQDSLAVPLLTQYAAMLRQNGADGAIQTHLDRVIVSFAEWARENGTKLPD